ncbi:MAG: AI-2E family transporter [Acidobacteria bacterium Pan2503]|uniref:AI-2E family transporter n=1 Tax=Candidatus Acidiferrum panamense TaxID=2741543 RepID=A0A7V8NLV6_9BACT|nr:AI-2E family transporter [Candidatus Acidoferrum panamensis]
MSVAPPTNATTSRLTAVVSYGGLLLLIYLVFRISEPFLSALGWAAILVTFFYPMHKRLAKRLSATRAAVSSTLAVTILLIAPAILLTTLFVRQAFAISRGVQHSLVEQHAPMIANGWSWLASRIPGMEPKANIFETLEQGIEKQAGFLAERLGTILKNIAAFVFDLFVMIFAMFYFFRDALKILPAVRSIMPFDAAHQEAMIVQIRDLISASVTTSLVVAVVQGALGGLGFAVVGLPAPVFWGVAMAFFSLVPVVGSGLIFVPASLWLGLSGHWWRAIVLLAICAGISTIVDNVLRPVLLGGRTELSGLVIFISVLGGVRLFGMLGLVLGPILVAMAAGVLSVYQEAAEGPPITAG